jgi:hypothetical protein
MGSGRRESLSRVPQKHILDVVDLCTGGMEHESLGNRLHAVDLVQQRRERRCDHLDEPMCFA